MDFELSAEQQLLRDNVARLMKDRYGFEPRKTYQASPHGWSDALWKEYADMGLLGAPFAEEDGGYGGGPVETMIVMEEFGKALALEPYLQTVVLCGALLKHAAGAGKRAELIGAIAARRPAAELRPHGKAVGLRLARRGRNRAQGRGGLCAERREGARRTGRQRRQADRIGEGLAARAAIATGSAVPGRRRAPGVSRRGYPTQDGQRAAGDARQCSRRPENVLGDPDGALPVIERAADEAIAALVGRGGRRDERGARDDRRLYEDTQAVRRDHRFVPGAPASRRRHGRRARTGAQHDVPCHHDGERGRCDERDPRPCPPPRRRSAARPGSLANSRCRCMAASP